MSSPILHLSSPISRLSDLLWHRLEKPLTGLLLTAALMMVSSENVSGFRAEGAEVPSNPGNMSHVLSASSTIAQQATLADGTYVYGQSSQPDQIGLTYLVFEVVQSQIVGGFYMPSSSFDCFQGDVQAHQLTLAVRNSYDQISYPYTVGVQHSSEVADSHGATFAPVTLMGYQPVATISNSDRQILATCKAVYQQD